MYDRFTEQMPKAMQLASQEAERLSQEFIGAEHILLGLIEEGTGVAARVLKGFHLTPLQVRDAIEKLTAAKRTTGIPDKSPKAPQAKSLIEHAMMEARSLHHDHFSTGHLLLALLHDQDSVAVKVLQSLGLKSAEILEAALRQLEQAPEQVPKRRERADRKPTRVAPTGTPPLPLRERANAALNRAQQVAAKFHHEYIGTEHLLLGLIDDERSVAAAALERLGIARGAVRVQIEGLDWLGPKMISKPPYPFTARAKTVRQYANDEAHALGQDYVGTGHQLLGLFRETEGVAAQVLLNLGVTWESLRNAVLDVLASEPGLDNLQARPGSATPDPG